MIEWVIERLVSLVAPITGIAKERRELQDNALRAISHALDETYLYYRDIELGKERNRDIEAQLSRYWSAAAIPIRHLDSELAQVCEHKSEYWVRPEKWSDSKVKEFNIGLNDVRNKYRTLLGSRKTIALPKQSKRSLNSGKSVKK